MTDIAIRVENLSKLYTIGRAKQRHDTLRDALVHALPRMTRISRKPKDNSSHSSNSWQKGKDNSPHSSNSWQESIRWMMCWRWGTRRFSRSANHGRIRMYLRLVSRRIDTADLERIEGETLCSWS